MSPRSKPHGAAGKRNKRWRAEANQENTANTSEVFLGQRTMLPGRIQPCLATTITIQHGSDAAHWRPAASTQFGSSSLGLVMAPIRKGEHLITNCCHGKLFAVAGKCDAFRTFGMAAAKYRNSVNLSDGHFLRPPLENLHVRALVGKGEKTSRWMKCNGMKAAVASQSRINWHGIEAEIGCCVPAKAS